VTWAGEALAAIRKIVLIEERINVLSEQVKSLADSYLELDRRLLRMEAKFELIEHLGAAQRKSPAKLLKQKRSTKKV
jgi:hypothetical protein